MLCLNYVAQPVWGKCEVYRTPLFFVPFLKLHTKLSYVIFITCNSLQSTVTVTIFSGLYAWKC